MTYVRLYGKPDIFLTFICNPNRSEIQENLYQDQRPQDRHDLIARVFHLKVKKLMDLITKSKIFGSAKCSMYSIEWQKRGLPHVHILIWLENKIRPDDIDSLICAEIPDPIQDPILHEIVRKNMIHGPCEDGYPNYRRRCIKSGGFSAKISCNGVSDIGNQWVVPYNPVLRLFDAHINIEHCSSIKAIKYICKYINKGSDQATFSVEKQSKDEITSYQSGRYVSSSEAVWRILSFPIHERYPSVFHLSVHLENDQRVYFTTNNVTENISKPPTTTLTAFFEVCKTDSFAKTLLYHEVPKYYTYNNSKFNRRKRVPGPTSFNQLKTVNGQCYLTFQSACLALGLLEDDKHWDDTMSKAVLTKKS
ncbi:hypothetical protein QTP88_019165 [Uroleucon formosanum]